MPQSIHKVAIRLLRQRGVMPFPSLNAVEVILGVLSCWLLRLFVEKAWSLRRALKSLGDCPGDKLIWLHPFRSVGVALALVFPPSGWLGYYYGKYSVYAKYGSTCLATVHFWSSTPTFWLSDVDAIKAVSNDRVAFYRDKEGYDVVSMYGPNMVSTDGLVWKRHRSVAKPAFNEANNSLVWLQSTRVVNEWFSHIDASASMGEKLTKIDTLKDITRAALLILSSSAFGRHSSWNEYSTTHHDLSPESKISYSTAVLAAIDNLVPQVLIPRWLYKLAKQVHIPYLGPFVNETRESFDTLRNQIQELITVNRAWATGDKAAATDAALIRNLVEANLAQEDDALQKGLTDEELISNTFMFLVAGHETSAHTLCFAVVFLVLHPDVQRKVFEEVERLWPDGVPTVEMTDPTTYRESLAKLEYTMAVFQETLRLFPPVPRLGKLVQADTTVTAHRFEMTSKGKVGRVKPVQICAPAGGLMIVDIIGIHYNPIYWGDDAEEFKPERFIDTDSYRWPRDAFLAFSTGPRSCLGERFAMTESLCILANVVRKYEILLPDEFKSKSFEESKKALLHWVPRVTLTPRNAHVVFRSRY